jgi:hypothetical protein
MPLLIVILVMTGIVLIYYGVTGKRPQTVIKEALANGK